MARRPEGVGVVSCTSTRVVLRSHNVEKEFVWTRKGVHTSSQGFGYLVPIEFVEWHRYARELMAKRKSEMKQAKALALGDPVD
jgi:hypothetical protein